MTCSTSSTSTTATTSRASGSVRLQGRRRAALLFMSHAAQCRTMRRSRPGLLAVLLVLNAALDPGAASSAREPDPGACPRPPPGSAVAEPQELRSRDGVLSVDLTLRNDKQPDGSVRYCYLAADGAQSPTLRLRPGDLLILRLRNALKPLATDAPVADMPSGH